jgi:hypothetical protein
MLWSFEIKKAPVTFSIHRNCWGKYSSFEEMKLSDKKMLEDKALGPASLFPVLHLPCLKGTDSGGVPTFQCQTCFL